MMLFCSNNLEIIVKMKFTGIKTKEEHSLVVSKWCIKSELLFTTAVTNLLKHFMSNQAPFITQHYAMVLSRFNLYNN